MDSLIEEFDNLEDIISENTKDENKILIREKLQSFIDNGGDINKKSDKYYMCFLHFVILINDITMFKNLVEDGADINLHDYNKC